MRKKEGKEEDRQQGSLVSSIENIRGFAFLERKAEGEGRERRVSYENESHKVLNLDFYSVVSSVLRKIYNLQSAKISSARIPKILWHQF